MELRAVCVEHGDRDVAQARRPGDVRRQALERLAALGDALVERARRELALEDWYPDISGLFPEEGQ